MAALHPRAELLERTFTSIGVNRMRGVPVLNAALRVQCVGFEEVREGEARVLQGILITPWFMNLVRLPANKADDAGQTDTGTMQRHPCGNELFDFIAAHEPVIGRFEVCSLFSPMFEFATHTAALETAQEILRRLRAVPAATAQEPSAQTPLSKLSEVRAPEVSASTAPLPVGEVAAARRSFLFGRSRPAPAP